MPETNADIFIIAGESSGDNHSAQLITELRKINPGLSVSAVGGSRLKNAGAEIILDYSEINFIGFTKILSNYVRLRRKFSFVRKYIRRHNPKTVVLCDFPGFNLRLARSIRKFYKGKIIYYITPQVWAWNPGRMNTIRDCVDLCLVVFPFEKELFDRNNIRNYYVGHPLTGEIRDFMKSFKPAPKEKFTVALMPGTRQEEISRMLPVMNQISKILTHGYGCRVSLISSENINVDLYRKYYNDPEGEITAPGLHSNLETMANSDFIVTKFGTSNLEAGLLGVPFCAVYRAGFLNYLIARMLIKIRFVSLVNIIFGKEIVKEFIQDDFTADNVLKEILNAKNDSAYAVTLSAELSKLWKYFGSGASNAAELILKEIESK